MRRPSRPSPAVLRRLAVPAAAALALVVAPSGASAASKACPTTGTTLATNLSKDPKPVVIARVWRTGGRTYGCTTTSGIAPRTRLLTKRKTALLRLSFDTVGWTAKVQRKGKTVTRVWTYDLANGEPWLSGVQAVPARAEGDPRAEGSVDQLRVGSGLFAAWVAQGSTVVIGGKDPESVALQGEAGGEPSPLYADGDLAVVGTYEADAATRKDLRSSLKIAAAPGDPGDSDDCAYSYLTAFSFTLGGPERIEARIGGVRNTPYRCP